MKDRFLSQEKPENPYVVAVLYFVVFFMSFLLIFVVFFQLCSVIGPSMENTLQNGDHVLLFRSASSFKQNDIVVITRGEHDDKYNVIKRVIGVAGDTLEFKTENGIVVLYRNGQKLNEPYIVEAMKNTGNLFSGQYKPDGGPFTVSEGHLFVMGDNRNNSLDSRGPDGQYPVDSVLGKMWIRVDRGSFLEMFLRFLYNEDNAPAK